MNILEGGMANEQDPLNSREFYELMQSYRNAWTGDQDEVIRCFEAVKYWVRKAMRDQDAGGLDPK